MWYGVLSAAMSASILAAAGGIGPLFDAAPNVVVGGLLTAVAAVSLVTALPCLLFGAFIARRRQWARSVLIVCSVLNLLNVPVGSVLGAYTLWVLLADASEPLFSGPPQRANTPKRTRRDTHSRFGVNRPVLRPGVNLARPEQTR
jgi:hypothetical protein